MNLAWTGALLWLAAIGLASWFALKRGWRPKLALSLAAGGVTVIWALGVWAFLWEPEQLVVRKVDIASAQWRGPPLRIGVVADTHVGAAHMSVSRLRSIVRRMNRETPDLVVLLGDYAGGHTPAELRKASERALVMKGLAPLGDFTSRLGTYAVLGNHDWWYDGRAIEAALQAEGVVVLENAAASVARPEGGFWIAGLADYESARALPSYTDALKAAPDGEPVLALSHWPDAMTVAPDRVALTLAAHSHCGQVNLPFLGRLLSASEGSKHWPCGLYDVQGRKLYVSGGVGVSILPVRFNQPPEIAIVTLHTAAPDAPGSPSDRRATAGE